MDEIDSCERQEDNEPVKQNVGRHRTKHMYNAIRKQMEFYFGDANLSKDRYMKQLIMEDPFVPLEVFLKFNKIKTLTTSAEKIAKALSTSTLLELNEEKTKVRRITEIPKERNVDDRSIYVECLPRYADHDWVINVFNRYGPIEYVSIPRYKKSRKIKEFAFIEFENPESVQKALNSFKVFNGVLSPSTAEADKLTSVTSYIKEQTEENATASEQENSKKEEEVIIGKRKKREESPSESEASEPSSKRSNLEQQDEDESTKDSKRRKSKSKSKNEKPEVKTENVDSDAGQQESTLEESNMKNSDSVENKSQEENEGNNSSVTTKEENTENCTEIKEEVKDENIDPAEDAAVSKKKKHRRRRKKSANRNQGFDNDVIELKIMPKKDWKKLRNQYLNLQRTKIAEAKRQLHNLSTKTPKAKEISKFPIKNTRNINFYGANPEGVEEETDKSNQGGEVQPNPALKPPLFEYEPGIIVQFKFPSPCVDVKDFKAEMKQYSYVKYVDVKEGALESFVRCDSANSAQQLIKQASCPTHTGQVISGECESAYWKKIMKDREDKLNKKVKVNSTRGREKVIKAIAKHIRFDEDD